MLASIGVFIAARLWRIATYSLGADEIFSLRVARMEWVKLVGATVGDVVHPPLFYLLLKAWIALGGDAEWWLRLLPVLIAVVSICPFLLLCREIQLRMEETTLALLLMAVNGYLIYYAQELRSYSLLLFMTLCSSWTFVRFFNRTDLPGRRALALFAVNLVLIFTHYFGWIVVGVEALCVVVWQRHKAPYVLAGIGALLLCFAPWLFLVTRASVSKGGLESNIGSFARPTIGDLYGYYALLNGRVSSSAGSLLGALLMWCPIAWWAWQATDRRRLLGGLSVFAFVPPVVAFVVSHVLSQSIWGMRFLVIAAAPYLILASVAICRLRPRWIRVPTATSVALYATAAGLAAVNDSGRYSWEPLVHEMIAAERSPAPGIPIFAFGSSDEVIAFYLEEENDPRFVTTRVFEMTAVHGDYFWLASRASEGDAPERDLVSRGYRIGESFRDDFGAALFPAWRTAPGGARSDTSR